MASDNEASCESDPNFAVICAFMEKFGTTCGLQSIDFLELQEMLENTQEVPQELIDLHIKLLRKSRKTVSNERWEKAIIKFCHSFCVQDAWEIERFGYKKARLSSKLRVLKELLEMQFDYNARFKAEINKMSAEELRSQPLGKDKQGHAYWFQNDNNCQIRVYKEDPDEETWTLVAKDRDGLASLISELSDGDSKISSESAINEEDSNSLAEKPIIDTGQVDSSSDSNKKMSGDSENSNESKESAKKEDNISPEEEEDDEESEENDENEPPSNSKRRRESDDEGVDAKKAKTEEEVGEAIEEPLMLVKGEGAGEENECVNPIVGEEIEEDLMFFCGVGSGVDCLTGNEDKAGDSQTEQSQSGGSGDARDSSDSALVSISDSKNCVNDDVPTSPVKSPYKLGTIIDTKTDNKLFSPVKGPTKKSRWDVETIMAKETPPPETGRVKELVTKWEQIGEEKEEAPKKSMFFFGPGCLQFKPATVGFGQKVPPEKDEGLEVLPDKTKGDVGYRIEGDNKEETSECVQSGEEAGRLVSEVDHEAPIESRIDKLDDVNLASDNLGAANVEQTKVEEAKDSGPSVQAALEAQIVPEGEEKEEIDVGDDQRIPEVTAELIECDVKTHPSEEVVACVVDEDTEPVPVVEETCIKKHAYTLGGEDNKESDEKTVENHQAEDEIEEKTEPAIAKNENRQVEDVALKQVDETEEMVASNIDENENKQLVADLKEEESVGVEEQSEESVSIEEQSKEATRSEESSEEIVQSDECQNNDEVLADPEEEEEDAQAAVKEESSDQSIETSRVSDKEEDSNRSEEASEKESFTEKKEETVSDAVAEKEEETVSDTVAEEEEETVSDTVAEEKEETVSETVVEKEEETVAETVVEKDEETVAETVVEKEEETVSETLTEKKEETVDISKEEESSKNETVVALESEEAKVDEEQTESTLDETFAKTEDNQLAKDQVLEETKTEDVERVELEENETIQEIPEVTTPADLEKETEKVEMKKAPDKSEPPAEVQPKEEEEEKPNLDDKSSNKEEEKETPQNVAATKRGRRNNSSDQTTEDKKPRIFTRRTTRSSKNEEGGEEMPLEVPPPTRRGRTRANQKVAKEETADGDSSKKMKMSNDEQEKVPPSKPKEETKSEENEKEERREDTDVHGDEKSEGGKGGNEESVVAPSNATETVMVESSSSSDVVELPDRDPLAVSEDEVKEIKEKPMSLATFSLDFNESPTPTPPLTRSGLRKRGRESPQNSEENEETGGKRAKMRGKRAVDVKLRKSVEEQKKKELMSSDDDSKVEQTEKKKHAKKAEESKGEEAIVVSSDADQKATESRQKKSKKNKNRRLLTNLGIDPDRALDFEREQTVGVRQSRRIAQLKIKEEAERRKLEEDIAEEARKKKKSKKHEDKDYKVEKKKMKNDDEDDGEDESTDAKKRKKKKKKHRRLFDELNPWRSSSDSSSSNEEDEMGEEEEEDDDEVLQYVSDHEFSPESDMEGDGEALPLKRARTARKESDVEEVDDCPCQKCGKSDHPEWILLCDSCDNGWHCSCLRPPLLVIPEGDWFCPPCQHARLLKKLQEKLKDYDKKLNKKEIEDRRKQRLAYVGISLNSVLPTKETENIKKRRHSAKEEEDDDEDDEDDDDAVGEESSSDESESGSATGSESGSDSDEPIYQLRQRRQAHSYRFNDYDELINSAIQEEMDAVKGAGNQGRGKDIATIVNAEKEEERKKESEAQEVEAKLEPLPPVVPVNDKDKEPKPIFSNEDDVIQVKKKIVGRKKHRKLNALDISSADDDADSDEDFKGTSSESDDEFDEDLGSEDSDDLDGGRGRRRGTDPVRRSTRARTSRYDADFIDDGDTESEDEAPRRKKKRSIWDESESEESDRSWGRRKRKPAGRSKKPTSASKKKKSKKKKKQHDSDEEVYKKKKPKIKFGLDGDDDGPVRRTRGKKINYVDALGSDSDEDRVKRAPPRIESDEEYVANEEDIGEDEKISEEEAEENSNVGKNQKIQIQSYTDARFTQLLPEPKNQLVSEEAEGELNPIDQINRNVEMMDENEMEKMMEEEEYANKQLQMVAQQLEKEKRRKEREAKKMEGVLQQPQKIEAKRPRKQKDHFQFSGSMQEPLVGNVDSLIVNSENNDELSEPPGVSLPLFAELGTSAENLEDPAKKRRGKNKKSLEEAVANLGSARQVHEPVPPFISIGNKNLPTDLSMSQDNNIEIAAPPQPFSQNQPTPSVITRMLQSKPGQPGYPVGTIRPKQFAAMPDREEDVHHSPVHHGQYIQGAPGLRPQLPSPYRQMAPNLNHYPRAAPPPPIRNPVPHLYHSHRPMDPSPSGGGLAEHHNSPGRVVSPASSSPGSNKNETPPPPYSRPAAPPPPPPGGRFPLIGATSAGARHLQMVPPPSHLQPPRASLSPYHPGMPPQYHYGQFGQEDALPPTVYQNSPYSEQFAAEVNQENSNSKSFEEESGGEFGGLVSYFSSQREDDLES